VEEACVVPGEPLVEIGAGLGVLTQALVEAGARVWALEVDSGFFRVLEERFGDREDIELIHADALKFDFPSLSQRIGRLKVVANLPYNISSRLIFAFHQNRDIYSSLTILLQSEVAERLTAHPGTKDYGVLTVLLGASAEVEPLFEIPGKAFYPVPEVLSTLVKITFPKPTPIEVSDPALLVRLVKASFAARRKTLKNNLKSLSIPGLTKEKIERCAEDAEIDLRRRGETLTSREFARFADAMHSAVS
jgi:16S rRNA (adenine1518-N6/adenine1519-N6)-dimethyltransferase